MGFNPRRHDLVDRALALERRQRAMETRGEQIWDFHRGFNLPPTPLKLMRYWSGPIALTVVEDVVWGCSSDGSQTPLLVGSPPSGHTVHEYPICLIPPDLMPALAGQTRVFTQILEVRTNGLAYWSSSSASTPGGGNFPWAGPLWHYEKAV